MNCLVYTDGSYDRNTQSAAWGCVIIYENKQLEFCGKTDLTELWNVSAEIEAATFALDWLEENKIKEATIYYDLINIGKWATGEWQRNKLESRAFYERVQICPVKINWVKVKGHSDCLLNNRADELAALGHEKKLQSSRLQDIMTELYLEDQTSLDFL